MDHVVYRRAGRGDKPGVLAIADNIYDGEDYLPSWYDRFIDDVSMTCYLAETSCETVAWPRYSNGMNRTYCSQVYISYLNTLSSVHRRTVLRDGHSGVAFCAGLIVDEGQTVVIRAGRVKPTHANRGIYRKLSGICAAESTATYQAFCITHRNLSGRNTLMKTHRLVVTKNQIKMTVDRSDLRAPANQGSNPLQMSANDLKKLFSQASTNETLFPGNRIIIDRVPFKPMSSNVPLFQSVGGNLVIFSDIREKDGCSLLTTWSSFIKDDAIICEADIYGNDPSIFGSHLKSFLIGANDMLWDKLKLSICFEPEVDSNALEKIATQSKLKRQDMSLSEFYLLEKQIDRTE